MNTETVKGFNDFTGEEAGKREKVVETIKQVFYLYGFEPAETPIIEYEEFVRGENKQDEAVSDIFKLQDKGKRNLALRYEFTFQLKRIAMNKKLPYKRYQIGPVFRDEPASSNRFRQFTQCDADIIGSTTRDEAEILKTIKEISKKLGIDLVLYVNNRKLLNEILDEQKIKQENRIEVIKIIDKLDKKPESEIKEELKKFNSEKILEIFKKPESFFKKYKSYSEIEDLRNSCKLYNVEFVFQPSLARGLSYYTGTVFEAKTKTGKESVVGGGAYIINGVQCIGYGSGLERFSSLAKIEPNPVDFLIISIGRDRDAVALAEKLRQKNKSCVIMYDKITKALEYANSNKIKTVIIAGSEEKKSFKLRDMKTGKEKIVDEKDINL